MPCGNQQKWWSLGEGFDLIPSTSLRKVGIYATVTFSENILIISQLWVNMGSEPIEKHPVVDFSPRCPQGDTSVVWCTAQISLHREGQSSSFQPHIGYVSVTGYVTYFKISLFRVTLRTRLYNCSRKAIRIAWRWWQGKLQTAKLFLVRLLNCFLSDC